MSPLLSVQGLRTEFNTRDGVLPAVADVSLTLARGEVLGLVGESGSGKSVTGFSILGLIDAPGKIAAGSILFDGQELVGIDQESLRKLRGKRIAMIFQDPMSSLNPVYTVGYQLAEMLRIHEGQSQSQAMAAAQALLEEVGPMAVSSANLTGQPAATTCQQAEAYLGESVQVYLDGGNSPKGEASTILDLTDVTDTYVDGKLETTGKIRIVRAGALSADKIRTIAGELLEEPVG